MTDNVTELQKHKLNPAALSPAQQAAAQEIGELQARLNAASIIFGEKLIQSRTRPDPKQPGATIMDLDLPSLLKNQRLFEIQFNAMINLLAKGGIPQKVILTELAQAVEQGVAELVKQSLARPMPLGNILAP